MFQNTGSGFATSAAIWSTPVFDYGWRGIFTSAQAADSWGYWATIDLDGDNLVELVNFAPDGSDGQYGLENDPHWKVFGSR